MLKSIMCLFLLASFCLAEPSLSTTTPNIGKGASNGENTNILVCSSYLGYYNPDGFGPYWALLRVNVGYTPGQNIAASNYEVRVYASPICANPVFTWFYMGDADDVVGASISEEVQAYATSAEGELELSLVGYLVWCEVWDKTTNTKVNEVVFLATAQ